MKQSGTIEPEIKTPTFEVPGLDKNFWKDLQEESAKDISVGVGEVPDPVLSAVRLLEVTSGGGERGEPRLINYRLGMIFAEKAQIFVSAAIAQVEGEWHVDYPRTIDGQPRWQAIDPSSTEDRPVLNFYGNVWQGHPSGRAGSDKRGIPLITGISLGPFYAYLEHMAGKLSDPKVESALRNAGLRYPAGRGNMSFECLAIPLDCVKKEHRLITLLGKVEDDGKVSFDITRMNSWSGGESPCWGDNPNSRFKRRGQEGPAREYIGGSITTGGNGQRLRASVEYLKKAVDLATKTLTESGTDIEGLTVMRTSGGRSSESGSVDLLKKLFSKSQEVKKTSGGPKLGNKEGLREAPEGSAFN